MRPKIAMIPIMPIFTIEDVHDVNNKAKNNRDIYFISLIIC